MQKFHSYLILTCLFPICFFVVIATFIVKIKVRHGSILSFWTPTTVFSDTGCIRQVGLMEQINPITVLSVQDPLLDWVTCYDLSDHLEMRIGEITPHDPM